MPVEIFSCIFLYAIKQFFISECEFIVSITQLKHLSFVSTFVKISANFSFCSNHNSLTWLILFHVSEY